MSRRWRLLLALLLLLLGLAAFVFLPLRTWGGAWIARAQALGTPGAFLFMGLFVPASVLCLPGTPITFFCAVAYGFWPTWPAAIVMSNLGAQAAFLVSRLLLAGSVERWVARRPRLAAVHRAIGQKSFQLVFLLRLTPLVPFNGLNYLLGVTPIRFGHYALATFLGMLPGTTLNCYTFATLGELGRSLGDPAPTSPWTWAFLGLRLLVAVLLIVLVVRLARRALADAVPGE
jgi:uncharacterized membrane protein YdjX (TVP38/TMEM64 family)